MLGSRLVTPQTDADGVEVRQVLIEAGADIVDELYLAVTLDRSKRRPVIIASSNAATPVAIGETTPPWGVPVSG